MTTGQRWRIGGTLATLNGLFLAAAVLGAVAWWSTSDTVGRMLTVGVCLTEAAAVIISLSVAVDHRLREVPWTRIGGLALVMLAGCGIALARRQVGW